MGGKNDSRPHLSDEPTGASFKELLLYYIFLSVDDVDSALSRILHLDTLQVVDLAIVDWHSLDVAHTCEVRFLGTVVSQAEIVDHYPVAVMAFLVFGNTDVENTVGRTALPGRCRRDTHPRWSCCPDPVPCPLLL